MVDYGRVFSKVVVGACVVVVVLWLTGLTLEAIRVHSLGDDYQYRFIVHDGMTLAEATKAWGSCAVTVPLSGKDGSAGPTMPRALRKFKSGRIVLFSRLMPSRRVWAHLDDRGVVDYVYYVRP